MYTRKFTGTNTKMLAVFLCGGGGKEGEGVRGNRIIVFFPNYIF